MLGAITVRWGIKGAPRCPTTIIKAAAATAALAGDSWGPAPARRRTRDSLKAIARAARAHVRDNRRHIRTPAET
eukprot:6096825-Lingulodinium_polyedra.AAC.1